MVWCSCFHRLPLGSSARHRQEHRYPVEGCERCGHWREEE